MYKSITLLISLISVLLLCGCGKSDKNLGTAENPYKLTWYSFGVSKKDTPVVMDRVNEYLRDKIGAELDIKFLEDFNRQINVIEASGEPFDICFTCSWANDYRIAAKKGYLLELNNLLKKYGQKLTETINPLFFKGTEINGKIYAVPIQKEIAYQSSIVFNMKYVEKYNFDLSKIKTLKDIEPFLKTIHEKEPAITNFNPWGFYYFNDIDFILGPNMPGAVLTGKEDNHKVINQYELPEFKNRMKLFHNWFRKGYISNDIATEQTKFDLNTKKTGNWFCTMSAYTPGCDDMWLRNLGFPVKSVVLFKPPIIGSLALGGSMLGISTTCERPDIAMKFLNLLNTDKYLRNLINFGIEGTHYKKIGDNMIEELPRAKDYGTYTFASGNVYLTYLHKGDPENKWEEYKKWDASAIKSPLIGFCFDPAPVKTQVAVITAITNEFLPLFLGARDPEKDLPKAIKKMKNAGLDKLLAEMQKQLDEWCKENK